MGDGWEFKSYGRKGHNGSTKGGHKDDWGTWRDIKTVTIVL